MDPKIKEMLIENGLKADATDEEAEAYMAKNNIKILDRTPALPVPSSDNPEEVPAPMDFGQKITDVENKLTDTLNGLEQKFASLNIQMEDNAEKDPAHGYKSNTEFFLDVIMAGRTGKPSDKLAKSHEISIKNAVGSDEAKTTNDPDGGFLIPPAYHPEVMETDPQALQMDTGARTRNLPMSADVVYVNARVDKNHSSSVSGGFRVYRRAETESVTASKGKYEQIEMKADSLMGLAYATNEILDRSPISFASLIKSGFQAERISKLNNERIRGTGAGEYMGILSSPALVSIAKESAQAADTINSTNVIKMRARIWGYQNAVWMVNQDCYEVLTGLYIAGTKTDRYIFSPENGTDNPATLLGRPVIFDENCSTLGDKGDIMLVNWAEYLEGQKGGESFSESVHVRFENNETAFKFIIYNAGAPWWRTALTPKRSTTTLSPFVALNARA